MGVDQELRNFLGACQRTFREDSPSAEYLQSRGYSFDTLRQYGLGYYRGSTAVPMENKNLRGCLWRWGEGKPAVVYPVRTLGGSLLGFQLGALEPGSYIDFFSPGAGKRGVFFYPDTFDWEYFHRTGRVVLVEGSLDACAISLVAKCVLSCLSARVTQGQVRGLERWAQEIYCAFDGDEAGNTAASKFQHFWGKSQTVIHRVVAKRKDPQAMLEVSRPAFVSWVKQWAPPDMIRQKVLV